METMAETLSKTAFHWWTPPRMWAGSTCFILGGGPSLKGFDFTPIHDQHVIGCNDAYSLGHWIDICAFGDAAWFAVHMIPEVYRDDGTKHDGLLRFPNLIVTNSPPAKQVKFGIVKHPRVRIMRRQFRGMKKHRGVLCWYDNTGAMAIHLALLLGVKRIVLLGFDMKHIGDRTNWHDPLKEPPGALRVRYHGEMHKLLSMDIKTHDEYKAVQILNATPDTALDAWPKVDLKEVLPC